MTVERGHIDHEADAQSQVENLAMLLRRILAKAKIEGVDWTVLKAARDYLTRNGLNGNILSDPT